MTDGFGWPSLQVAEETVLPLGKLAFTGKKFQDIRTSISRAGKGGITAEWIYYHEAPLSIRDQIQAISEEWVSDKALPEMGFTLGGLDELDDPAVRCLIAVDQDRTIHGITSWMPCYRDGVPVGWTLDFMRRRGEGFKGVMEFLIGTAALDLQKEGAEFVSLSGAPLAQANPGEEQVGVQKLLGGRRQDDGAGVRVPVAAEVQGQVPAGVPADVHVLPGGGRAAPDRPRYLACLPAEHDRSARRSG